MKKLVIASLCAAVVIGMSAVAMAGPNPGTGIKSTSHDLSTSSGKGATWAPNSDPTLDRICIYCHAPHNSLKPGESSLTYYPLWNHALSTIPSYQTYDNGTDDPNSISHQLNATLNQPSSVSKLCLSCHDGDVAIGAYGYSPQSSIGTTNVKATSADRILIGGGGDLRNHHPISFDYEAVAAIDDEIKTSDSVLLGNNPNNLAISDLLWNSKMECSSCHDVHNTKNMGMKFLWVEDINSNLCLSCHKK
jgi:predicted CXXCH cytochrome family protein